jgi:hypothetical protein
MKLNDAALKTMVNDMVQKIPARVAIEVELEQVVDYARQLEMKSRILKELAEDLLKAMRCKS